MTFADLQFHETILRAIKQQNYRTPTLVQEKAIPFILDNKDVIVSAQTGSGKTAAFALPIIQLLIENQDSEKGAKKIKALVVSPTRELALQIEDNFLQYSKFTNLRTTAVFGGVSIEPQKDILKKGVDILIATPGRLIDLYSQKVLSLDEVSTFVLDEADLMLDMGFINDVKRIEKFCPRKKQILLFSATMPDKIADLSKTILRNPEKIEIHPDNAISNKIGQLLYKLPKKNKTDLCLHLLRNTINGKVIIFRRTKFGVDKLEQTLLKNSYDVISIHGDKTQALRNKAIADFKQKKAHILVATDVAARGIDIPKVDAVINFDISNIPETYVHRIGRTGRAGKSGIAFTFCSPDEDGYIKLIEDLMDREIKEITDHPYPRVKPQNKKKPKNTVSRHKKSRKSANSKKNKKRWY